MHSMAYWVVAFGGERAVARYKEALQNCAVTVHNPAAPVELIRAGTRCSCVQPGWVSSAPRR